MAYEAESAETTFIGGVQARRHFLPQLPLSDSSARVFRGVLSVPPRLLFGLKWQ